MIASFGDRATEDLYHGRQTACARRFPHEVVDAALVKMDSLNGAASVLDLRAPLGNRLESLKGDLKGNDAHDVRLTDYH